MGRLPSVGRGPSIKRPESPIGNMIGGMLPPMVRPPFRGPIGGAIGGMLPPTDDRPKRPPFTGPIGGVIGGVIGGTRPTKPRPDNKPNPEYAPGYGGRIGLPPGSMVTMDHQDRDGDGFDDRDQKGPGYNPFTGKIDDRLLDKIKRKEEERRASEERKSYIKEKRKTDPTYGFKKTRKEDRVKPTPRSRVRSVPEGVEDKVRFQPVDPRFSRRRGIKPNQDRRTRDFNPNLESFDAKQYLSNYGDLQKAFGTDEAKARQHFIDYGIKEGRVDTAGGGTLKADIRDRRAKTFKAKRMAAAAKRREGFVRGEEGATFDAKQYLANYKDLQDAFGTDEEKARQHYKQYGAKEGRVDTRM